MRCTEAYCIIHYYSNTAIVLSLLNALSGQDMQISTKHQLAVEIHDKTPHPHSQKP